ncbi:MAG: FkbM family methyltransferase [Anaerolineales bacterium]|nr:FkbM family methyltransferase [Anaerolineales bacterium]
MIEFFLRVVTRLAGRVRFLMPIAIRLSVGYLQIKYRAAFLEEDEVVRAQLLRRLALLRQKIHPPIETFVVDVNVENEFPLKMNVCQQYCGDIYYGIGFEHDELNFVKHFVTPGGVFFDVGANMGVYTLLASRLVGEGGHVHAFEPLANVFGFLEVNVELNDAKNISLNPVAVGEEVGEVDLFVNAQAALTGLGRTNRGTLVDVKKVPIWTLDYYAERSGIQAIDFLKVDVEGFEGHVLRGAKKLLLSSPNLIVMSELANKNFEPLGFSVKEVLEWMHGIGFEAWMIKNDGLGLQYVQSGFDKYPFQNFVFIRRANEKYSLLKKYV